MHSPRYSHCQYLDFALETKRLRKSIALAVKALKFFEFDAIAFRGMSGAMIAPMLALRLDKTLIMVRKNPSDSHSGLRVEGDKAARRYVIVDDFVSMGDTACEIIKQVNGWAPEAECIGVLQVRKLYTDFLDGIKIEDVSDTNFVYPTDFRLREAVSKCRWAQKDSELRTTSPTRQSVSAPEQNLAASAVSL